MQEEGMELKAVMIVIMMIGNTAVSSEKVEFSSFLQCKGAMSSLWLNYERYADWARDPTKFSPPQSGSPATEPGIDPPTIPMPIIYCIPVE